MSEEDGSVTPIRPDTVMTPPLQLKPDRTMKEGRRGSKLTRAQKRNRVLELRAAGMTMEQIADTIGSSKGGVTTIVNRALKEWAEQDASNVEMVRQQKLYELDQLKRAIWPRALKGELAAVREATRIIQVQARISGAEAPVKVEREFNIGLGIDPAEIERLERAWRESGSNEISQHSIIDGTAEEMIQNHG